MFPEGRISTTGALMRLFDGTGFLLHHTKAKVITAHLMGAQRLPFSPNPNRRQWFPRVSVHFSQVLTPPDPGQMPVAAARNLLVDWVLDRMREQRFRVALEFSPKTLLEAIRKTASNQQSAMAVSDIKASLTYKRLFAASALLASRWRRLLHPESVHVGMLLPNMNAAPATLLSLWSIGKVPAILNYSTGTPQMLTCARLAGVRQVVTSRKFAEQAKLHLEPLTTAGIELIYLEDVRSKIGAWAKLAAMLRLIGLPVARRQEPNDTAVVLFTSGSEGVPKGVRLSHANLLANVHQVLAVCDITERDSMFCALPLFHSFGLTTGLIMPLVWGGHTYLYPSPLHYRQIPSAVYMQSCTILLATNTFLNLYARHAHPYDFRQLRYLFAGAEKVQEATSSLWARKFGVRIMEGYGATECSPVVSVNTPLSDLPGSAGKLLPGIEARIEPVEGVSNGGRLFVRGPNVMSGYLNPDAQAKFAALDGWYDTGDIASIDNHHFIHILGRLKRFAKISGEMVSLAAVEEALAGAFPHFGLRCQVAIVAQPCDDKGEALVAVTNEPRLTLAMIRQVLREKGQPNIASPRELRVMQPIPMLGTGKTDHRTLEKLLRESAADSH
jgi:acyl-[acyl-carrier-protein]-phospholipid O-acyltransferase/long-chain-fatty-acid--[acyl-carrier-protein] ligase